MAFAQFMVYAQNVIIVTCEKSLKTNDFNDHMLLD